MRVFFQYQLPALLWAAMIFVLSSLPSRSYSSFSYLPQGSDKVVHFILFFILCLLFERAFRLGGTDFTRNKSFILALAVTIFFGASDEFHQLFVAGRNADFYDLLADSAGGFLAVLLQRRNVRQAKNTERK